ncbi:MAG: substrate-binding periplasmic protein [Thermodesulfobacteriota bacterium]
MNKYIPVFFLVFLFILPLNLKSAELEIVCDIWPPYQIETDSGLSGYSVELVETVVKKMGISDYSVNGLPWKRAVYMLENGQADALFSANYTKEREDFAFYPDEPLIVSPWVVWVKADSDIKFEEYSDLAGLTAGVVRGYSYTDEFWSFLKSKGKYDEVAADETNFKKLKINRIDYTVAELGNGYNIMEKLNIEGLKPLLDNPVKKDGLYMIFNKDRVSQETVEEFSETLKKFKNQKEYELLYNNYFK